MAHYLYLASLSMVSALQLSALIEHLFALQLQSALILSLVHYRSSSIRTFVKCRGIRIQELMIIIKYIQAFTSTMRLTGRCAARSSPFARLLRRTSELELWSAIGAVPALRQWALDSRATEVEPLVWTVRIVAPDHLSVR